jgi:hypothetical protein
VGSSRLEGFSRPRPSESSGATGHTIRLHLHIHRVIVARPVSIYAVTRMDRGRLQISARRYPGLRGDRRRAQRRYSRGVRTRRTRLTAGTLFGVAALHAAWGAGKSFPFRDRQQLADAVVGTAAVPPAPACYAVAGALTAAAALVQGFPAGHPTLRRVGLLGVAVALGGRGVLGLTGRTDLVSPASNSARFRRLDRNLYSPLCLALARGAWSAASAPSRD